MGQFWRLRVHALGQIAGFDARRGVADRTVRSEKHGPSSDPVLIAQVRGCCDSSRVSLDGTVAHGLQDPVRNWPVRLVCTDIVEAGVNKSDPAYCPSRDQRG